MNPKILLVLALSALATDGAAIHSRQKRTLGLGQTALDLAGGALGAGVGALGSAAKIGTGLLVGKTLLLGLGGKYALYKYLKNKSQQDGLHFGVSGGVGGDLPFIGEQNFGGSAGFGFGGNGGGYTDVYEVPAEQTYISSGFASDYAAAPVVYDVSYDSAPVVTYDSAPVVTYASAPVVSYDAVPSYVAAPQVTSFPQVSFDTVSAPAPSSYDIDSYGAPQADLLG